MFDQTILLASDLTVQSRRAEQAAFELARRLQLRLVILHVVWERSSLGMSTIPPEVFQPEELSRKLEAVGAEEAPEAVRMLVRGNPAEAIVDVANKEGASMIVVGTQRRSAISRAVLGSVAESVMRQSPCPVLLVAAAGVPEA